MVKQVTPEEVVKLLENNTEKIIVDIREDSEVAFGKIPGAKHIPLSQLVSREDELSKDKSYIITCQSGNRSKAACGILETLGYQVEDMIGGMNEWSGKTE